MQHKFGYKVFLLYSAAAVGSFLSSLYLLSEYIYGDQFYYRRFYSTVSEFIRLQDIIEHSEGILGASEPISLWLLWLGSYLQIEKDIWISLLNSCLLVLLLALCRRYRLGSFDTLLLSGNYYLFVLMTSAERLKISFLLIAFGLWLGGRLKWLYLLMSPLAHFQNILIVVSVLLVHQSESLLLFLRRARLQVSQLYVPAFALVSSVYIFASYKESVTEKIESYISIFSVSEYLNFVLIAVVGLVVSLNRFRMFLALMPLLLAISIVGATRLNIIAFLFVITLLIEEGFFNMKTKVFSLWIVRFILIYFVVKSFFFIRNVFDFGDGYGIS